MRNSNDVLTQPTDQEQVEPASNSIEEQLKRAKQYNQELADGKQSIHVWAQIDFTLNVNLEIGFCRGLIHYQDGRKLSYLGETTKFIGDSARMHTIQRIPTQVLPYEQLVNTEGDFYANGEGIGSGGELTVTSLKRRISPFPWKLEGIAPISWLTEGTGKFLQV